MELDARELQDLAGFFGRRFPDRSAAELGLAAGVSLAPSAGWTSLVAEAARRDRLPQLAAAARAARPGDPNMEELGRILGPSRRLPRSAVIGATLGLLVLLAAGFAVAGRGPTSVEAPAVAAVVEAAPVEVAPVEAAPVEAAPVEVTPAAAPTDSTGTSISASVAASVAASESTGVCRGAPGSVVGYFHAGSTAPGQLGETVTISRGARVRADYPDRHNHFNASAPVRCVIPPGSSLRLDAAPIAVPGAAVWVPVVAGSVL